MEGTLRRRAETAGPQVAASSDSDREREDWFVLAMTMSERIEAREGAKNGELGEERRVGIIDEIPPAVNRRLAS
jgi:hypothetical protein